MRMEITGRNIDITPAIREFTREKLSRLDRWIGEIIEVHVVLSVEKHRHHADLVVKGRLHTFTGTDETGDMYASIGNAVDKIDKQARRHKDKTAARRKRALSTHEAVARTPTSRASLSRSSKPSPGEEDGDGSSAMAAARIFRIVPPPMKPMSVDDAALLFRDPEREFLVFRESRSQRIRIMYRRRDGHLGLIEPND